MALKYDENTKKLIETADPEFQYNAEKPGEFTYADAPTYTDSYKQQIDDLYNQILNRKEFSYDPQQDESYKQYEKTYTREGNRAMEDTLATVAARTGGLASTYAASSAQQANQYYMQQLADKIPELRKAAYDMYLNDLNMQRSDLDMLRGLSNDDYGRFRDTLSDYYTNRDFDYGIHRDSVNDWYTDRDFTYGQYRDDLNNQNYYAETLYGQGQDSIANARAEAQLQLEREAAGRAAEQLALQQAAEGRAQQAFDRENTAYDDDVVVVAAAMGWTPEQAAALKNTGAKAWNDALAKLGIVQGESGTTGGNGNSDYSGSSGETSNYAAGMETPEEVMSYLNDQGVNTMGMSPPVDKATFQTQRYKYEKAIENGTPANQIVIPEAFKMASTYPEYLAYFAYSKLGK